MKSNRQEVDFRNIWEHNMKKYTICKKIQIN
jgi:hypothetical protein